MTISALKTSASPLDLALFRNPTAEFRGAPFWSWNSKLDHEQLIRQIDAFQEMGLGGFHIHVRTGLQSEYLGTDFMDTVSMCVEEARKRNMLVWLYDEDRWPSGFGGGRVTENPAFRAKYLLFTHYAYGSSDAPKADQTYASWAMGNRNGLGELLARYEVLIEKGCLKSYRLLPDGEDPQAGSLAWYAYLETMQPSAWYNGQTYVDTLDPRAIQRFIDVTHEVYAETVGEHFGEIIPAIFTDEPQLMNKKCFRTPEEIRDLVIPWTGDFAAAYQDRYQENILAHLPELFWELPGHQASRARYRYHDFVTERFVCSFADQIGKWCEGHGIALTGHVMEEPTLESQTSAVGEAMRSYRSFQLPGIDILCDGYQFNTAKQAQSAARQFGCRGVTSELYGVTNWDFDFLGHKAQGDWQAAMGITLRVHHLSWVSMAGEAKRDYPASISYQSPWYREYPLIEDHFARLNTILTRGRPVVRVGVIHPIESFWLCFGPVEQTAHEREEREARFSGLTNWFLQDSIDFDFISESLIPLQEKNISSPHAQVGMMEYEVILLPAMRTIRSSTLAFLERLATAGGTIIFAGEIPSLVDAEPSDRAKILAGKVKTIAWSREAILAEMNSFHDLEILDEDGKAAPEFIYQMREENGERYLFICNIDRQMTEHKVKLRLAGSWHAEIYDTLDGTLQPFSGVFEDESSEYEWTFFRGGSLLLKLTSGLSEMVSAPEITRFAPSTLEKGPVPVLLSEPNVLLLDQATWRLDDGDWQPKEEILKLDNLVRAQVGLPARTGDIGQPYSDKRPFPKLGVVEMLFKVESAIGLRDALFAVEDPENLEILVDGTKLSFAETGWWVDEAIRTVPLPTLAAGPHEILLRIPFNRKSQLEWCYLLGDFGVKLDSGSATLTAPVRELLIGDWSTQGLPFYAGNVTYQFPVQMESGPVVLSVPHFKSPVLEIKLDGERVSTIAFPPYECGIDVPAKGRHLLEITVYGNRINSFGCVHNTNRNCVWYGPDSYRTEGKLWSYDYFIWPMGILTPPVLSRIKSEG